MGSSFDINESPQWIDCFIRSFSNDNHLIEQSNDTNTTLYQNQDFTLASSIDGLYQPTDDNYEFTSIQDCSERLSNFMESYSPPILEIPSFLEISPPLSIYPDQLISYNQHPTYSYSPQIPLEASKQSPIEQQSVKIEASEAKKTPSPAVAKKSISKKSSSHSSRKKLSPQSLKEKRDVQACKKIAQCRVGFSLDKKVIIPIFLALILKEREYNPSTLRWVDKKSGTFKVEDQDKIAELWAIMKKKKKFCYGNFSRSIRHHHHTGYLVHDRRKLIFKFSPDFTFWK
ncbi:uncharacterized protein [Lepeophtheirus salmonis]|uniref:ETS domain-containing protein n=1 Tax=Lepeophtheirus salmonis TaxID=72036 RepID=A0A0K2UI29_LEPSM|nr:ETS-related transcription factor Elf-3-like [Lepeophtheirus salmonis]